MDSIEVSVLFISAVVSGLVGIAIGCLTGYCLTNLAWRLNATSPDMMHTNDKDLKVVDVTSDWSLTMLQKCVDEADEKALTSENKETLA